MNLLYINWDINPEIANILGIPLKYYGLLFLTGLVLSLNVLKRIYQKEKLSAKAHDALFTYALIGIMVGARLGHCIFMILIIIPSIRLKSFTHPAGT